MNNNFIMAGQLIRSTKGSAGYDIILPDEIVIKPDEERMIDTQVQIKLQDNCFGLITARSSLYGRTGCIIVNAPAIIDSDYNGVEDVVRLHVKNLSNKTVKFEKRDRIAQLVILPFGKFANEKEPKAYRNGGIGSTGR